MENVSKPQGCTNLKLRQLDRVVTRHYDQYLGKTGLKNTQYALLSHVVKLGPVRPVDLARHMHMDASTLTRNLRPLASLGLLTSEAGPDARSHLIQATEAGIAKRAEAQRAWKSAQTALNELLGHERVVELHTLLDACMGRLSDTSEA